MKPIFADKNPLILWAIDPFEPESLPSKNAWEPLRKWIKARGAKVEPVHVLEFGNLELPQRRLEALQSQMTERARAVSGLPIERMHLLARPDASIGGSVEILIRYAHQRGATALITSSHGRSGLSRLALGSFAEKLILESDLPVLVFGHGSQSLTSDEILFATDFSQRSKSAFIELLGQVHQIAAQRPGIRLYHCVTLPGPVLASIGAGGMVPIEDLLADQQAWAESQAQTWRESALKQGVKIQITIDRAVSPIYSSILRAAEEHRSGRIALASKSGSLGASLLGSIARQVVRHSPIPVEVFGNRWNPSLQPEMRRSQYL